MDIAEVMDEVAARIRRIPELRVFEYPADKVTPPAAVVTYPDEYLFDATYGRGSDTMTLPVMVLVGKASARSARDELAAYCKGSGPKSVKSALEAGTPASCDTMHVTSASIDVYQISGVDYLCATFMIDIMGSGA